MPVIRGIEVEVDAYRILRSEGNTDHQMIVEAAEWAAKRVTEVIAPAVTYRFIKVEDVGRRTLRLDGTELTMGPSTRLLKSAQQVLVGVTTLGPHVETEVKRLHDDGRYLESYLLNSAAFAALDSAAQVLKSVAEDAASARGWGVSAALSPGTLPGWDISGQLPLCSLLDLEAVDVELTSSQLLKPRYSLSLVIGLGKDFDSHHVGDTCPHCSLRMTCRYRTDKPAPR